MCLKCTRLGLGGTRHARLVAMRANTTPATATSLSDAQSWLSVGVGALLLAFGMSRRSTLGTCVAISSIPLLYRGIVGEWPSPFHQSVDSDTTKTALSGPRGIHVRESIQLEVPVTDVYRFWRRLENLPTFMRHLDRVTEDWDGRSHWVAKGPAGLGVEWDAEIINEVGDKLIAWQSLPGSDVVSAGSVHFDAVRAGQSTRVTVHLQYEPPAGAAGAVAASLFGVDPSHTIREDLRRLKQMLEAGETPGGTGGV